jgi:TatD DNase family protein
MQSELTYKEFKGFSPASSKTRTPKNQQTSAKNTQQEVVLPEMMDMDCNFTHKDLASSVVELISEAKAVGVTSFFVPGSSLEDSRAAVALASAFPSVCFASAGVHPYCAPVEAPGSPDTFSDMWMALRALASDSAVTCVGECGLDASPGFPPLAQQLPWFTAQLDLALELQKPLFLHERLAFEVFADELSKRGLLRAQPTSGSSQAVSPINVLVHCFTGSRAELKAYVDAGFYVGITGYIFQSHKADVTALREALRAGEVPLDRLVVETDAPYMGFKMCRRRRPIDAKSKFPNVPSALPLIVSELASLIGLEPVALAQLTTRNARRFLGL